MTSGKMAVSSPSSEPRILVVANRFYPQVGGAELVAFNTCRELSRFFRVEVITPLRDDSPRVEVVDNITIRRVWNAHNPRNKTPYLDWQAECPEIPVRILAGRYSLVHCFPAMNRNNLMALSAARARGIPAFLTNYDAFNYAELLKQGMSYDELSKLTLLPRQAARLARFSAILTISNRETALLRQANPNTFLSMVPVVEEEYRHSPDTAGFRQRHGLGPAEPFVLCLGRVSHIKGQDILLKAIAQMQPDERPKVVVAGRMDYEPEFEALLREIIRDDRLEGRVILTGPLSREDALAALAACEVHILPVRFMNSGAVVVETWASGRPVLQSNRVDPNYVVEGENGYTFDVNDPRELAAKLKKMLTDADLRNRMGDSGSALVQRKFYYRHLAAQHLAVYREYGGIDAR